MGRVSCGKVDETVGSFEQKPECKIGKVVSLKQEGTGGRKEDAGLPPDQRVGTAFPATSKGAGLPPTGEEQEPQRCEQGHAHRATVAEAKDNPELKEHLEAAHAAVTAQKTSALLVKD
eukprot:4098523-Amphidinium_carterae.1